MAKSICELDEKFIDDVRMYGKRIARYDLAEEDRVYDDTESVFLYEYDLLDQKLLVTLYMSRGQYTNYFIQTKFET